MGENLIFAVRGSDGLYVKRGITDPSSIYHPESNAKTNPCRVFKFSNTGQYFAYCDTVRTVLVECVSGKEILNVDLPRTQQISFSSKDRTMTTFEPYTVYGMKTTETGEFRQPAPNLRIWTLPDGTHVKTLVAAKQNAWRIQWTDDEVYSVRLVGSEILVHKYNNFDKYDSKLVIPAVESYVISPGSEPHHLAAYVPASGGQPAVVQVRRLDHKFTTVANKTFFKCDNALMSWNCKGSSLLVMASMDVDPSNLSYYGEQHLFLIAINGDSCMVPLAKEGPVYCVKWNPNGKEFAACYGFMPSRVTLYNLKGNATFDLGEGARNDVFYNRFGSILLVCGFGNIASGRMEFWNVDSRKEIIKIEVPNTTLLEWSPDGQHLLTATTTPRLRIDNGYRIWHYSGRLIYEYMHEAPSELWQIQWRPIADGVYNPFAVAELTAEEKAKSGLRIRLKNFSEQHPANNLPAGAISKTGAYVPPHLRKSTGCNKGSLSTNPIPAKQMSETEKKIKNLQKKIDDIAKLKKKRTDGESLEVNQLLKIEKENELLRELESLRI